MSSYILLDVGHFKVDQPSPAQPDPTHMTEDNAQVPNIKLNMLDWATLGPSTRPHLYLARLLNLNMLRPRPKSGPFLFVKK